jgi:hypothetical protein
VLELVDEYQEEYMQQTIKKTGNRFKIQPAKQIGNNWSFRFSFKSEDPVLSEKITSWALKQSQKIPSMGFSCVQQESVWTMTVKKYGNNSKNVVDSFRQEIIRMASVPRAVIGIEKNWSIDWSQEN